MTTTALISTALKDTHLRLGAKMVPFGGFELPVWYSNIKEEHHAVRNKAGCFDISHMGIFEISGERTLDFVQRLSCNDATRALNGTMTYSMVLNPEGGVKDDVMFGFCDNKCVMIVNGSNRKKIMAWFLANNEEDVQIIEKNDVLSMIAVQGPDAKAACEKILAQDLSDNKPFSICKSHLFNESIHLMHTGYTGEDGFELIVPNNIADKLWVTLVDNGVTPCGLGARDSLRLEKGLPLYGQDLNEDITPWMTRYKWVVKLATDFIGKPALEASKENTPELVCVGLEMTDKKIPRSHYPIQEGGEVTSGSLSPSLGKPIALAFVTPEFKTLGSKVHVMIRDVACEATVVEVPFK